MTTRPTENKGVQTPDFIRCPELQSISSDENSDTLQLAVCFDGGDVVRYKNKFEGKEDVFKAVNLRTIELQKCSIQVKSLRYKTKNLIEEREFNSEKQTHSFLFPINSLSLIILKMVCHVEKQDQIHTLLFERSIKFQSIYERTLLHLKSHKMPFSTQVLKTIKVALFPRAEVLSGEINPKSILLDYRLSWNLKKRFNDCQTLYELCNRLAMAPSHPQYSLLMDVAYPRASDKKLEEDAINIKIIVDPEENEDSLTPQLKPDEIEPTVGLKRRLTLPPDNRQPSKFLALTNNDSPNPNKIENVLKKVDSE